jgi:hypothetical protein
VADVIYRGNRLQLRQALASIGPVLAGRAPDPQGIARGVQLRVGVAALSQVQQDFLLKSRGGTGRDGISWPPLKPETIARRRRSAGDVQAARAEIEAARLRGEKRPTVVQLYGSRQVDIGRDTDRMFRSLSPGVEDRPSGAEGQVFETPPGAVIVGTNVPYAEAFHAGRPEQNQPARPMWPLNGSIPAAWWPAIIGAAQRGVAAAVALVTGRR